MWSWRIDKSERSPDRMEEFSMMKGLGDCLGLDLEIVGPEGVKDIHPLLDVEGEH